MGLNSWYSVRMSVPKVVKPSNSSSQFLWQDIMGHIQPPTAEEDKKLSKSKSSKIPAGKARRIRLFPTQEERLKLRKWIGTARWTYNQCLSAVEKEGVKQIKKDL